MNRRSFLKFLGTATVGTGIVYSFPSIIVPKNIAPDGSPILTYKMVEEAWSRIREREIYPKLIEDFWFQESPFLTYMRVYARANTPIIVKGRQMGKSSFRNFINNV